MDTNVREKIIGLILLLVVGIFVLDKVVIGPVWTAYQTDVDDTMAAEKESSTMRRLVRRGRSLQEQWKKRLDVGLGFSTSKSENQLLAQLDIWINQAGLSSSSIRTNHRDLDDQIQLIECATVVNGSMVKLVRFCWFLETTTIPFKIDKMEFVAADSTVDKMTLTLELSTICMKTKES